MDTTWTDWQVVAAAMEQGSFTAAADALGVGQATVSRRVAQVEEALGHRLFDRHRTGLVLTEAAERLRPHLQALAAAVHRTEAALDGLEATPRGEVRITAPPAFCVDWMPRLAVRLAREYPAIELTVLSDVAMRDLDRREADVAIRLAPTTRGELLSRRLATFPAGIYASPAYAASLPEHPTMQDLALVQYAPDQAHLAVAQWIASTGARIALRSNEYLVQRAVVQAGLAAGLFSALEAGTLGLVPIPVVLPSEPVATVYLVVHQALRAVPRVAVVVEGIEALVAEILDA